MSKLPLIVWSQSWDPPHGGDPRWRVVLYEHSGQELVAMESCQGKDALGNERWEPTDDTDSGAKKAALLGMAQLIRGLQELLYSPQQPASANMSGNVDPTDPTDCRHVFGAWNRSHKLQNRWRQCQACGAVETISAQAGREALDPNATAYLNPAAAAEQRRRTQVPTEQADPPF